MVTHGKNMLLPSPPLQPRRDARPLATNLHSTSFTFIYQSFKGGRRKVVPILRILSKSINIPSDSKPTLNFTRRRHLKKNMQINLVFFASRTTGPRIFQDLSLSCLLNLKKQLETRGDSCYVSSPGVPSAARTAAAWRRRSRRRQARLGFAGHGEKAPRRKNDEKKTSRKQGVFHLFIPFNPSQSKFSLKLYHERYGVFICLAMHFKNALVSL